MAESEPMQAAELVMIHKVEIDRVARLLMEAWEQAEGTPVTPSYVATFADMARAVIADAEPNKRAQALAGKIDRCTAHMRDVLGYADDQPDAGLESLVVQAKHLRTPPDCTCRAGNGLPFPAQHATLCPRFSCGRTDVLNPPVQSTPGDSA